MASPSTGTLDERSEDVPSESRTSQIVPLTLHNEDLVPIEDSQVSQISDRATHQQQNQLVLADGDYRRAYIGSKIETNIHYNFQLPGESRPKKPKIAEEVRGLDHLDRDIYINLKAPIAKHSRIYEGLRSSGALGSDQIAVKLLPVNTVEDAKPMVQEARAIRDLSHPNVVRYITADYATEKFMCMYLAMEMCKKTNLYDHVLEMRRNGRRFSFNDCMSVAKQLTSALKHLHKKNILHRDIKPSNVLFSKDGYVLKLTDFSLVKPLRPGRSVTADSSQRIGTDGWRAPEVYIRNNHGKKSDVFSLGLLLYYVWSDGEQAFGSDPDLSNFNIKMNMNKDLSKIYFENPEQARLFLEELLQFDETLRISADKANSHYLCRQAESELENPAGEVVGAAAVTRAENSSFMEGDCIVVFDKITFMMLAYKPSTNSWGHLQVLPDEVRGTTVTVVCTGEYIYALLENRRVFRIKYIDANAIWEPEESLLLEHGSPPPSTFLEDSIYVIGGRKWSSGVSKKAERFSLRTRTWSMIPDMQISRGVHSVTSCNGCVYSIGGRYDAALSTVDQEERAEARGEKFDPGSGQWFPIAPMHGARHGASAAALKNKIYVLGGWRLGIRLSEAECYNTNNDTWTMIKRMNIPRSYLSAVGIEENVYAISGDNEAPMTIEKYDPTEDKWETIYRMDNMNTWTCAAAAIVLPPVRQMR